MATMSLTVVHSDDLLFEFSGNNDFYRVWTRKEVHINLPQTERQSLGLVDRCGLAQLG